MCVVCVLLCFFFSLFDCSLRERKLFTEMTHIEVICFFPPSSSPDFLHYYTYKYLCGLNRALPQSLALVVKRFFRSSVSFPATQSLTCVPLKGDSGLSYVFSFIPCPSLPFHHTV